MKLSLKSKKVLSFLSLTLLLSLPLVALGQYNPDNVSGSNLADTSVVEIITAVMNWLLLIVTIIAVIGFIISGILFITAGGSQRQESAKGYLMYSIIGIIVALIGWIVINLIDTLLKGQVQGG